MIEPQVIDDIRDMHDKEQAFIGASPGFERVDVFRPGMLNRLVGDRAWENALGWMLLPIRVDYLASAMISLAEQGGSDAVRITTGNSAIAKLSPLAQAAK